MGFHNDDSDELPIVSIDYYREMMLFSKQESKVSCITLSMSFSTCMPDAEALAAPSHFPLLAPFPYAPTSPSLSIAKLS